MTRTLPARYFLAAGACLIVALATGLWGILLTAQAGGGADLTAFIRLRPIHVTFAVAWIVLAATGSVYAYLPELPVGAERTARVQFWLLAGAGAGALASYLGGAFTGREYLEFPWPVSVCILAAWVCFLSNLVRAALLVPRPWPAYVWMWLTGGVLFLCTFVEAHLWMLPRFFGSVVGDLTVQWKSYGALVGSWNMLVYGASLCLGDRLTGGDCAHRPKAFLLYWLGLANLLFGYAHHTYHVPQAAWIRWMSFCMSMSEWAILLSLLWEWTAPRPRGGHEASDAIPRLFLSAASFWIVCNLLLALLISIPQVHWFTHGTQVTLAHAMGSTIGINTMILLAVGLHWMLERSRPGLSARIHLRAGFWIANISLALFWGGLLVAGLVRGLGTVREGWSFHEVQEHVRPLLRFSAGAGAGLSLGLLVLGVQWCVLAVRARRARTL
ncbi:MAG: cbb3-type cytochrome c oxidase subunit I [Planctomycetes bacterium]|nr:cbb3-type cytochrome c oxidase subunit I [Planctomycetota bacterium]